MLVYWRVELQVGMIFWTPKLGAKIHRFIHTAPELHPLSELEQDPKDSSQLS